MTEEALAQTRAAYGLGASVLARPRLSLPPDRARPGRGLSA